MAPVLSARSGRPPVAGSMAAGRPFGGLLAAPKDGKPVTQWPDINAAFLDITTAIKAALRKRGVHPDASKPGALTAALSKPEVGVVAEELQTAGVVRGEEHLQHPAAKQSR